MKGIIAARIKSAFAAANPLPAPKSPK